MEKGKEEKSKKKLNIGNIKKLAKEIILIAGLSSVIIYSAKSFSKQSVKFNTYKGERDLSDYDDFLKDYDINYKESHAEAHGDNVTIYVKQPGEHIVTFENPNTIPDIAKLYKMNIEELTYMNHLKKNQALKVGQKLKIYWLKEYTFTLEELDNSSKWIYHNIAPGETLSKIAENYNTSEEEIMKNNEEIINKDEIQAGSTIRIKKQKKKEKQKTLKKGS